MANSLGKRLWWFPLAFSPCGLQGKLNFLLRFSFTVSKFVYVRKLVFKYFESEIRIAFLSYPLVWLSFTLHLFCIPCSSTRGNASSEMVCKSTYMYDRVNKCTAKYLTDHGWTNLVQETVQI